MFFGSKEKKEAFEYGDTLGPILDVIESIPLRSWHRVRMMGYSGYRYESMVNDAKVKLDYWAGDRGGNTISVNVDEVIVVKVFLVASSDTSNDYAPKYPHPQFKRLNFISKRIHSFHVETEAKLEVEMEKSREQAAQNAKQDAIKRLLGKR